MNSEILIQLEGGATVAAIVTNESAQELGLKQGSPAVAIFKASNVILGVLDCVSHGPGTGPRRSGPAGQR